MERLIGILTPSLALAYGSAGEHIPTVFEPDLSRVAMGVTMRDGHEAEARSCRPRLKNLPCSASRHISVRSPRAEGPCIPGVLGNIAPCKSRSSLVRGRRTLPLPQAIRAGALSCLYRNAGVQVRSSRGLHRAKGPDAGADLIRIDNCTNFWI